MPVQVSDIMTRLNALKRARQPYEAVWKKVTEYILPRRSFWDLDATPGQEPATKLYDGMALSELQLLVDGTLGNLVSSHLRWLRLTMEDRRQNDLPWVADWLEEVEDVLYAEFARSNFYEAMSEFFLDAASVGTSVMLEDDDVTTKSILFSCRHMKECYIAEARNGRVDTLFREFNLTNRQAMQTWGDKLSRARRDRAANDPDGKARMVHAVFPRAERTPGKVDKYNKAWVSLYIDAQYHADQILDEGGFDHFPYLVWRWRKNSDEIYGRSPATDALQDVVRLNAIGKSNLGIIQLAGQPPLMVPTELKGFERIVPRGYNYYTDPAKQIFPINLAQNYPMTKDQEEEIKEQIRNTFRTKMFLLLEQLEGGPYTATEINARQGEKTTVQGPMIGRLNSETLIPLIKRTYAICERNGLIPPPPAELERGGRIHIEFQGPLALQTKKYHQAQGIEAGLAFVQATGQLFPESLDQVDGDELMRIGMDTKGMPQKTIRERPQVSDIRKMRLEAQEKERQEAVALEEQKMLAGNANKLNEPVKPGSMLAGLGKAIAQKGSRSAAVPKR